ncbi:MAG: DUF1697 domain-containing protein [Rhizorhabdus sp.]
MEKIIVLLRGINVGGHRKVPMAELRAAAQAAGITDFTTYIQSGNLIFTAKDTAAAEDIVETIVEERFGFKVEAIARTAKQWAVYAKGTPFADADERGNLVHLGLSKKAPAAGTAGRLAERAVHSERIVVNGDAIWIDFKDGVADTKLTPAFIDRVVGSTVTMRNWRTVVKVAELSAG